MERGREGVDPAVRGVKNSRMSHDREEIVEAYKLGRRTRKRLWKL